MWYPPFPKLKNKSFSLLIGLVSMTIFFISLAYLEPWNKWIGNIVALFFLFLGINYLMDFIETFPKVKNFIAFLRWTGKSKEAAPMHHLSIAEGVFVSIFVTFLLNAFDIWEFYYMNVGLPVTPELERALQFIVYKLMALGALMTLSMYVWLGHKYREKKEQ